MIVYEIVGALVVLGLLALGLWKFSEVLNQRKRKRS